MLTALVIAQDISDTHTLEGEQSNKDISKLCLRNSTEKKISILSKVDYQNKTIHTGYGSLDCDNICPKQNPSLTEDGINNVACDN
tara:strand:+ start:334 stop:588 length:255 start_codon:yes stop_codon:yes gene_type:complete